MKITRCYCLLSALALIAPSFVSAEQQMADGSYRPTIALVLAGGGAKGAAHIGVLKALEEMQIPVDIVTGTSMGSYVGGLYALGMTAQEVEQTSNSVEWNKGYQDRVSRSERRVRDNQYDDRYNIHTDLGVEFGKVKMPTGVVQGQNMLKLLRQSTNNIPAFSSFDSLAIPYRAVATNLETLEPVVLDKGQLTNAMMASMSVPGAIQPYELDDKLLVDGGVTNNMPIDVAKSLGADIVIAVDISSDYKDAEELQNILGVAGQLVNYMVKRSTEEQMKLIDNRKDVLLRPEVGAMETTEFDKMPQANALGYQAAMQQKDILLRYAISTKNYQAYQAQKQQKYAQLQAKNERKIAQVTLDNQSHYNPELLINRLDIEPNQSYSDEQIEQKIHDLYALDRFELISYNYEENADGSQDLNVSIEEKDWGPNYLDFRFAMEDNFQNANKYSVGFTANFTGLSDNGAELRTNVEICTDKLFGAELYYPLNYSQSYFTSTEAQYSKETADVFFAPNSDNQDRDNVLLDNTKNSIGMDYRQWQLDSAIGYQYDLSQEFRLGLRYTYGQNEFSSLAYAGNSHYNRYGIYASYQADTLDDYYFPTRGFFINSELLASFDQVKQEDADYEDVVFELNNSFLYAHSFGKHTLVGRFDYGLVDSDEYFYPLDPQSLGGFLNLSGIPRDSLSGRNKAYTSLVYRYKWFDNDFGLFSSPVYLGASAEYGGVWSQATNKFNHESMYVAGSAFIGVSTPVGPVFLGYGQTEQGYHSGYLMIGSSF